MKPRRLLFPASLVLSLAPLPASAQTIYDWKSDAPDGNWTQGAAGARWYDNTTTNDLWDIPTTATGAVLRFNNNAQLTMTNNAAGTYELHGMIFGASATSVRTIGGNAVRFFDFSGTSPYISNDSSATHVINLALNGDGGEALKININSTGGLTFGGAINNQGGWIDVGGTTTSATTVSFNGAISGAGGFYKANSNITAVLASSNSFTGKTTIDGGIVSIAADSGLGTAPGSAVADQLTLNGGTLRITAAGQTLNANRGITLGASGGTIDASTIGGSGITTTIGGVIAGNGPLTLRSTGNMTAGGGGDSGLGIRLNQATNTFTGDVTITSGLVSYANNASFGNAANKIILNGGGLLDNNQNVALSRDIQILAGGGTFRAYGSTNVAWSGAITGSGTINRTDGGTLNHSGDLSGFNGTYNVQGGTTQLTGTAATIGGNWTVASGTTLTINSSAAQALNGSVGGAGTFNINSTATLALGGTIGVTGALNVNGLASFGTGSSVTTSGGSMTVNGQSAFSTGSTVNLGTGVFRVNGTGVATINSGVTFNADQIAFTGNTSNQLNIAGGTVTTRYLNLGDSSNNSGRVVQTGGNVTVNSGGNGFRIGHWNNGSNAGSLYNLSGGVLDASAITANIGWDGQGDMIVGGGAGSALFRAAGIQLDANGNGGGSGAGDMTLTVSANGTVEVGTSGIGAAAAGDRIILNGGSIKATGNGTWGSVITATTATTSSIESNGFNVTLNNNITGTGTINLASATGSVIFNTGGSQTVTAGLNGVTAISKTGSGTTTLSGTGSHSGTITVNDGRLNLAGSTASNITVTSTRNFGGEGATTGSLTLAGTNNLFIDPSTPGGLGVGNLTLTGTNTLRFDTAPGVGPINVLTYTGTLTGSFGTNLVYDTANTARYRTAPAFTDTSGVVTLDLGSKNLAWNGTSGGQWDVLTSARWNAAEADQFAWGDAVTFDDTGVSTAVTITGELQPSAITVTGTQNHTITGGAGNFISGLTGLTKSGTSTLVLNAPNTFSGTTTITGGTVQVGDGTNNTAALGTGAVSVGGGSSLVFFRNGALTLNQSVSGAGTLAFRGTGVSGQSEYTVGGNNSAFAGTLEARSGARVSLDSTNDVGTSSIVVNSGGQIFLTNGTTYSNAVSLNGIGWTESAGNLGAVRFTSGATLSGAVTLAGDSRLTAYVAGDTGTISGNIGDGGSGFGIAKTGAGVISLAGTNTYSGATTVSEGLLRLNSANAAPGGIGASGGTSHISLAGGVLGLGAGDLNRALGTGASQIQLANTAGFAAFTADRTVNFGGAAAAVTWGSGGFNPSTLVLGHSTATHNLSIANPISLGAAARTVQVDDGAGASDGQLSGVVSGAGSLVKTGAGTLTLTQANTYSGGSTLSAGRINIRDASSLGTGAVTLGDASSGSNAISLYLENNRISFSRAITVTSNGAGTVTLGSMSSVTGSGDNNQFTSIALQRDVTFDSNAADRTDYENITGTGNITITGVGRSMFMTANTYSGNLTIRTSTDANGLQLGAVSTAFNALSDTGSVQIDSGGKLTLSFTNGGSETIGALNGAGNVRVNSTGNTNTLILGNGNGTGSFSGIIGGGAGTLAITKTGSGTQTLSGANTYAGATAINGGTLALDYATQNNSKLSDTAALTFGAGTSTLSLAGGSHTEVVSSTTLAAGASANVTRASGTSVLQLGTITVGANATLNLSAASIATTNNTNTAGMLGAWATVGTDWAVNSTNAANGPITAFTGYVNYTRLSSGTKSIASNAADNARIQEGTGTAANLTLAAATTNINTLNQTATGGATTIDMGTNTLRLGTAGGILAGPGVSALTIGGSVNQGFLSAGGSTTGTAGTLYVTNNSSNTVTINSAVINNGTGAVTLVKNGSGRVDLAGNTGATFSGGTFVNQGELRVVAPTTAATYATLGTGAVTVNTGATLNFFTGSTTNTITYTNAINLNNATLVHQDGNHTLSGNVSLSGTNTITGVWADKNLTLSGVISGAGSLIKTNTGGQATTLTLSNINTYTGGTTVNAGTLRLSNGGANGAIRGTLTVNSGAAVTYGAANAFGYTGGSSVNVLNIVGGTVGNAGFSNHFWNNFQLNMTAGTLNLGVGSGGTTNEWQSPTITTSASATTATIAAIDTGAVMRLRDGTHATFNVADGGAAIDLSVTAAITQSGGTSNITKNGAGLMQISGVNAYTGTTTINAGTLRISGSGSLNSGNYAANITNNGVLEFTSTAAQTLGGIISGTGSITKGTGTGTLTLSNNNTYTGPTTIGSGRLTLAGTNASSITINSGATLTGGGSTTGGLTTNAGATIALNGLVPATGFSSSGAVNFAGATAVAFDVVPTALGVTQHLVAGYGTLTGMGNLTAPAGYRTSFVDDTGAKKVFLEVTTGNRTWNRTTAGTWDILTNTSWLESDTLFAGGDAVLFDDTASNGSVTLAGTLLPSSVTFNNTATSYTLSGAGVIGGTTGITKNGSGTASISSNNTYSGATAINAGTLNIQHANALGATTAGTTVASGAALEIQGGITTAEAIAISGTGVSGGGAIRNISGTNTISGGISLTAASTITSVAGGLTLSGAVTSASGTQTLTIGGGSVTMSGANNTVDITINGGTLFARGGNWSTTFAGGRTITVNTGGTLDTNTHSLNGLGGGSRPANIVINEDAIWKLNGEQQLPSTALTLNAGIVNGPGEVRGGGTIASVAHATKSSVINAPLSTGNGAITFNVADGAVDADLSVTGNIGGGNAINKNTGTGTLVLSGNNGYSAATNINAGALRAASNTALGTTAAGTTVASGAALQLSNNITIGAEALGLGGSGVSNDGALRNISGDNTYNGAITLSAAARINSDAGTLTLGGNVVNSTFLLTLGGAGTTTATGIIGGGSGGLTMDGTGTVNLNAANTYTGNTAVDAGRLNVNGSITSAAAVAAAATLGGDGTINGAVNLTGTLLPGQGGSTDRSLTINGNVTTNAGSVISFTIDAMNDHDQLVIGTGNSIGLANADLEVNFDESLTFDILGAGEGDDFLAALDAFAGTGSWFKLISGTTTGMFNNVTDTLNASELAYFGLSGTQYKTNIDGQDFWVAQGSAYLVAIPEPRAALLGGIGVLLLLRRHR